MHVKAGLWGSLCDLAAEDAWVPAALPVRPPTRQLLPRAGPEPAVLPWPRFVLLCAAEHACVWGGRARCQARPARRRQRRRLGGWDRPGGESLHASAARGRLAHEPSVRILRRGVRAAASPACLSARRPRLHRPRVCVRPAPLDSPLIADLCPRRTPSLPGRPFKVPRAICFLFIGGHGGGERRPLQVLSSASIDPQAGLALSPR